MKEQVKNQKPDGKVTIFRYQQKELEAELLKEHTIIMEEVSLNLAKDLATLNKPEADKTEDHYSDPIFSAYRKMGIYAKKELQVDIESHSILSDKEESKHKLEELHKDLSAKENNLRLTNRQLEKEDNTLLKKDKRYQKTKWFLRFIILVDTFLSAAALQAMEYSLIASYIVGSAIGMSIFLIAEYLPQIINKGSTMMQKRLIALGSFTVLAILFYVLGIFRTFSVTGDDIANSEGIKPIYFMCLNLFFVIVSTLAVYFNKLTKAERQQLDEWKLKKEASEKLTKEVEDLKSRIQKIRTDQAEAELTRKQLLIYAQDVQELIQSYFEQSLKTFYSTNLIHRSDGKTPLCFSNPIPQLPVFYKDLKLK
ncbi:hypothetical protein GCM10011344_27130 [Dokdonia pacifica]|uniref:Uncharacterized protein n=1 Tax=Dokdonia pacifica TaxID=1627892 RepID=A0A239E6A0_9FLAO|nr:hypothetical protein [Dokdonia pacifica]GGG25052.1 hypothetical protein GCM10011344_27130 [Dokdonia pacifica]SNS40270.1 hypothetical protein SAMN06265376_11431 [Dokdonia pacifica]